MSLGDIPGGLDPTEVKHAPRTFDQLAELHVAGLFAEAGWRVYFPHRDDGFDFIAVRAFGIFGTLIRPVQVKGKYPEKGLAIDQPMVILEL